MGDVGLGLSCDDHPNPDAFGFSWGTPENVASRVSKLDYFRSFFYNDEEYFLYDTVFVHSGTDKPYVAKIMRLWEGKETKGKRVRFRWFFGSSDIPEDVKIEPPCGEKELFIAEGDSKGAENVNDLATIICKCNMLCTYKDSQNQYPAEEEIEKADFLFARSYNVITRSINSLATLLQQIHARKLFNAHGLRPLGTLVPSNKNRPPILPSSKMRGPDNMKEKNTHKVMETTKFLGKRPGPPLQVDVQKKLKLKVFEAKQKVAKVKPKAPLAKLQGVTGHQLNKRKQTGPGKGDISKSKISEKQSLLERATTYEGIQPLKDVKEDRTGLKLEVKSGFPQQQRKIFRKLEWKDQLEQCYHNGLVLLLKNFNPSFQASDISEALSLIFPGVRCEVSIIPQISRPQRMLYKEILSVMDSGLHLLSSGHALVCFNDKGEGMRILQTIQQKCLVLSDDGRPLLAHIVEPPTTGRNLKFPGHINKSFKMSQLGDKWKNAVATSHCSQPNTIEYEMAVKWRVLQEQHQRQWEKLLKNQGDDIKMDSKEKKS